MQGLEEFVLLHWRMEVSLSVWWKRGRVEVYLNPPRHCLRYVLTLVVQPETVTAYALDARSNSCATKE
jgi:hypothetical protein